MSAALHLRPAGPDDAEALARSLVDGLAGYRDFAPEGWEPPTLDFGLAVLGELLTDPDSWACIAEDDAGALAGQSCVIPAAKARNAIDDPALGHLLALFIEPPYWGTGLARRLHAAALDAARERGYTEIRLFTAKGQARARRFYEREGWYDTGRDGPPIGALEVAEYRRGL